MKRLSYALCPLSLLALLFAGPASAAPCRTVTDDVANTAATELLQQVVKNDPQLAELDEKTLLLEGGKKLIEAPQPDYKARGWMMLLWYGGKPGQEIVASSAEGLETEEDRAHLYFVMGLFQLGSPNAETAAAGRSLLSQVKDTGKVTFVPEELWTLFLQACELPG